MVDNRDVSGLQKVNESDRPDNMRGALFMVISAVGFTIYMLMNKLLSSDVHPLILAFVRAVIGTSLAIPFLVKSGFGVLRTDRPGLLFMRSLLGTLGFTLAILAVSDFFTLTLAQFSAISFTRPLFVTILAMLVLREHVGAHRWSAIFVGFFGVLLMVIPEVFTFWRPGALSDFGFDFGNLVALASAFTLACAIIMVKMLTGQLTPMALLFYANIFSTLILSPVLFFYWEPMTLEIAAKVMFMGLAGFVSQICYISAMRIGDASFLSPLDYVRLPFSAVADFFVFRLVPGLNLWMGALIIIASTLYVAWRERRAGKRRPDSGP